MEILLDYFLLFCSFQMIVSGIHPIMTSSIGIANALLISFGFTLLAYALKSLG